MISHKLILQFIRNQRIRTKLFVLTMFLVILTAAVSGYIVFKHNEAALLKHNTAELAAFAKTLDLMIKDDFDTILAQHGAINAPRARQISILNEYLTELTQPFTNSYPDLSITIYCEELHSTLLSYPLESMVHTMQVNPLNKKGSAVNYLHPVYRNNKLAGHIAVSRLMPVTIKEKEALLHDGLLITGFILVFGTLGVYALSNQVVKDVEKIKDGVHSLKYNLDYRITPPGGEMGEIADAINNMAANIKQLNEASRVLNSTLNIDEILRRSVGITVDILKADICSLMLLDNKSEEMTIRASHGLSENYATNVRFKVGEGIAGRAVSEKRPITANNIATDNRAKFPHLLLKERVKAILAVPVMTQGNAIGALTVYKRLPYTFTKSETDLLQSIANQVGLAVENASLYKQMETLAVTDSLTGIYNHKHFQERLEEEIQRANLLNKPVSLLMLDIDYFKHYNDTHGHQAGDKLLKEFTALLNSSVRSTDLVARYGGEEFAIVLREADSKTALEVAEKIRQKIEQQPFLGREQQPTGKITASIGVASYPTNGISREEILKRADEALYRAKETNKNKVELYFSVLDDLKVDLDQSERSLINTIKTLIMVINAKDRYTYGHSERVVQYSVELAKWMDLPMEEVKLIKYGAFLHDIGKIEIDRNTLNKEGALSREEWDVLKQHPYWGADIIKPINSLELTLPIIMHHHERFDGTGYPMGYAGEEIPFNARLLAVADSFDAMTVNRSYQKAKSFTEALRELERCAGTQFDPELVKEFVKMMEGRKTAWV